MGGYPANISFIAKEVGLLKNVEGALDGVIGRADAARMVYNALIGKFLRMDSISEEGYVTIRKDITLLEFTHHMTLMKGIVEENAYTSYIRPLNNKNKNYVKINGREYLDCNGGAGRYLGHQVMFLINNDSTDEILSAWSDCIANTKTLVECRYIEDAGNHKFISREGGKKTFFHFAENAAILKNNVAYPNWTYSDFYAMDGYVELIDNNGDDIAEVVNIFEPTVMVVEYTEYTEDNSLYIGGINGESISMPELRRAEVYKNGSLSLVDGITRGNLVFAYVAPDNKCVVLNVTSNSIKGTLEGISDDSIIVNGTEYELSDYFKKYKTNLSLRLGMQADFVFDINYKLVFVYNEEINREGEYFGFIQNLARVGMGKSEFRIFGQDNKFINLQTAKRIMVDGQLMNESELSSLIASDKAYFQFKFALYKINNKGELAELDTENYSAITETDSSMIKSEINIGSTCYRIGNAIWSNHTMQIPIMMTGLAFEIPVVNNEFTADCQYDKYYKADTVNNVFGGFAEVKYPCAFYGVDDEFGYPVLAAKLVRYSAVAESGSAPITDYAAPVMIVENVSRAVTEDGKYCFKIKGATPATGAITTILLSDDIQNFYDIYKMKWDHSGWFDSYGLVIPSAIIADELKLYTKHVKRL